MKQAVFLCREEGLGGKKNSFSSVCEEACKIDEPYMWNVIWCWEGRSKSAEGGFMEGGPWRIWKSWSWAVMCKVKKDLVLGRRNIVDKNISNRWEHLSCIECLSCKALRKALDIHLTILD